MPILQTENLTKVYGAGAAAVTALDHVNLSIEPNSLVAIMGPSGCGKSTLLHLLGGLDAPTEGHVSLDGVNLSRLNDTALTLLRRRKIGFVFQFFNLIPVLSALENVMLPMALAGEQKRAEPESRAWLQKVGLGDRLARALVTEPAVVLADEPTGNLDSRSAEEILRLLRRTVDEWGRTVVMVTHDARMAAYADRIIFLKDGTVVDDTRLGVANTNTAEHVMRKMEAITS
jgi:putative ABC transport system ATP-binding protein